MKKPQPGDTLDRGHGRCPFVRVVAVTDLGAVEALEAETLSDLDVRGRPRTWGRKQWYKELADAKLLKEA